GGEGDLVGVAAVDPVAAGVGESAGRRVLGVEGGEGVVEGVGGLEEWIADGKGGVAVLRDVEADEGAGPLDALAVDVVEDGQVLGINLAGTDDGGAAPGKGGEEASGRGEREPGVPDQARFLTDGVAEGAGDEPVG